MKDLREYLKIRDQIKTGDSIFWASRSLLGVLIRWRTEAQVNHIAKVNVLTDGTGKRRVEILEAMENGMQNRHLSERLQQFDGCVYWAPLNQVLDGIRSCFCRAIEEMQDRMDIEWIKYDYAAIVKQLFHRVGPDGSTMFCSEADFFITERAVEISAYPEALKLISDLRAKLGNKAPSPGDLYYSGLYQKMHQIL